jgi:hypothetical protein
MIRNENEYRDAVERVRAEADRLAAHERELAGLNLSAEEIKRVMDPMRSFHEQLKEEVAGYERLKRGEFAELSNFRGLGGLLVSLRIALGLTQRELASRMEISESQVSRDERNEYHGVTVERAGRILDALGVELRTQVTDAGRPIRAA